MNKQMAVEQLDKLLSEAFTTVRDNYGMPNSREVAEYLIEHGIAVHYMKENSWCWRIDARPICTADDSTYDECCRSDWECENCKFHKCKFNKEDISICKGLYNHMFDDALYGISVFATLEEAEAKVEELQATWRLEEEINS